MNEGQRVFKPCSFNGTIQDLPDSEITCVEFSPDNVRFAVGDLGGHVYIYHTLEQDKDNDEFSLYSRFKSHEPEFDFLKSTDISEQIVKLKWLKRHSPSYFILTTNHKTIKLWRLTERNTLPQGLNFEDEQGKRRNRPDRLIVPRYTPTDTFVEALQRKVYENGHTYQIHSISTNPDNMSFLSSDDLRINLWHLEVSDSSFNIVDIKPESLEDLSEVITSTIFHPNQGSIFAYTTSIGGLRVCDMRNQALCDSKFKSFQEESDTHPTKNFFSEIIVNTSDVKFSQNGNSVAIRNFMNVKVWDIRGSQKEPLHVFPVHDQYRSQLCKLYENDCIFDRFDLEWTEDDRFISTGSYNGIYKMFDVKTNHEYAYEASCGISANIHSNGDILDSYSKLDPSISDEIVHHEEETLPTTETERLERIDKLMYNCEDFDKKLFRISLHPNKKFSVFATQTQLFMYKS